LDLEELLDQLVLALRGDLIQDLGVLQHPAVVAVGVITAMVQLHPYFDPDFPELPVALRVLVTVSLTLPLVRDLMLAPVTQVLVDLVAAVALEPLEQIFLEILEGMAALAMYLLLMVYIMAAAAVVAQIILLQLLQEDLVLVALEQILQLPQQPDQLILEEVEVGDI
jgi:hypothetical protein